MNYWLLKSEPSLYEFDMFDGNSLQDNINQDYKLIPTEFGVYKCLIHTKTYKYYTDCGIEYEVNVSISDVVKLNLD